MLLLLLLTAAALVVIYFKWNFAHWQRRGFPYIKATIPFGVLQSVVKRQRSFGMAIYDAYQSSKEKVVGIYLLTRPALLIRDAQLARDVLSKDFNSFHDRGVYVNEEKDPMSGGLFFLKGSKWKILRSKLMPSFTSGKLRGMFGTIEETSYRMINYLNNILPDNGSAEVELKNLFSTYAIDIIASVIFGLETNSFKEPNNVFRNVSYKTSEPTYKSVFRGTCQFLYPSLEKFFVMLGWTEEAPETMKKIVRKTVEHREKNNVSRRDMLQLLLQLRNTGKINTDDNEWSVETSVGAFKSMSVELIAAQLFLFYVAGYETTASTVAFTIYELSQYPELLAKAKKDVEETLRKYEGKLSYECVQDMKFLDLCVMETIRKYPGLPILNRECTEDYQIPDSKMVIKKGTAIIISLFGMHRDPEYFPDPMRYDPERFLEENMNYNSVAYMPFGEGPRHCIAQRMGRLNAKVAIAQILTNFDIELRENYCEIEIDNFGIPILPKGGVNVRLSKKKQNTVTKV
ncbi:probable cytochrome P450 6d5 [Teleopsis dalmanni]|uniref:probable cytochrome P450 6d5 n=1 Tax=Teleopsis dalmanni TaxID=139649 RepID=UPI0018CE7542|nr:probable cytochrome P450 6d5 [Teleopsis dalmanni]